eukprot:COSAG06_NODE_2834_length_6204_cov_12.577396_10_plen_118_part_00
MHASVSPRRAAAASPSINLLDAGSDYNGKDEQPITTSSTSKPPIHHLACLVGAWPGHVRSGSSDLDLLTRVSISEDIDPNLHTPTNHRASRGSVVQRPSPIQDELCPLLTSGLSAIA